MTRPTQKNLWSILFVTSSATALIFLDSTVMPVSLPTIQKELLFSKTGIVWVVNSYLLALVTFMLIGGRLCDLWGVRRSYRWGLVFFFLGSTLAALSFSKWWLLAGRALQGMGGALTIPATGALIMDTFPPGKQAKAIGINTGIGSLFLVLGPPIGGIFTQYLNWRGIFWINIPVILFIFVMSKRLIPLTKLKKEPFHLLGAAPLALAIIFLVGALMEGSRWGWTSSFILSLFGLATAFFLFFCWVSLRSEAPIIDFSIFKRPYFRISTFCIFITQFLVMATVFWALYFQQELGFSAAKAGFLILLATLPVLFFAPLAGFWADKIGPKIPILFGYGFLIFSLLWFTFFPSTKNVLLLLPGLLPFGCGIPLIMSPSFPAALSHVPSAKLGTASALVTTLRQFASTLGIALMSAIFYGVAQSSGFKASFSAISFLAALLAMIGMLFALLFLKKTPVQH